MKLKKTLFLAITLCIGLSTTAGTFAESKNKSSDSELQYIKEMPINEGDVNSYLKTGSSLHTERLYTDPSSSSGDVTAQWGSSGGSGGTHQTVTFWGYEILKNDKGLDVSNKLKELVWDTNTNRYIQADGYVTDNSYLTDELENDSYTYAGHFYGPGLNAWGVNYLGQTSPTAYTRYNNHYYNAVTEYKNGHKMVAYQELGKDVHYLEDLNNPFHASNRIAGASYHTQYEGWVDTQVMSGRWKVTSATSAGTYNYVASNTFKKMSDDWASSANSVIGQCDVSSYQLSSATATSDCLARSQRAVAGLLYRFLRDTYRI